ncbi:uncharacterized protein LOC105181078 [Harpegnathos saltator]|uniref:uncharacterized protein LOC105181078 n=1 Tax=Harpegnathos saltator TaxID=610380 RepID=UPI000DBEF249|nr:uncharacterized protein LOC105181078 [Harpegnathos saltator]
MRPDNRDWTHRIPSNLFEPNAYNIFFYPNLCHVCKGTNAGNLILCKDCLSISYCSDKHKHLHREEHTEFCVNMKKFLRLCNRYKNPPSRADWVNSRRDLVRIMRKEMQRPLMPYEEEMIMFARSCYICFQEFDLRVCEMCYSAYYCEQHKQQFQIKHNKHCWDLMFCLNLEMRHAGTKLHYDFSIFPNGTKYIDDMEGFMKNYYYLDTIPKSWSSKAYIHTDFVSTPLTVLYGIISAEVNVLNMNGHQYFVHIITSSYLEAEYAAAWELFLHTLYQIKQLTVVIIGLECKFEDLKDETTLIDIFSTPNMNCPYFLLATSKSVAKENKTTMKELLNLQPAYNEQNKFRSFHPWRDFQTGSVYYRNNYVTIYPNFIL